MDQVAPVPVIDGSKPAKTSRAWLVALIALVLITIAVYAPVFHYPFITFDDPEYVADNPIVQKGLSAEGIRWAMTTGAAGNWHPLTWMSYMLDVSLFGAKPQAVHGTSVVLHVANALLLWWLLKRMTGSVWRSVLVAALFALHPLHVESVAWIAERKDVLSTFLFLATLHAYGSWCRRATMGAYVSVAIVLALGLMAKPMLVTTPAVMLLLDAWPLGRMKTFEDFGPRVIEKIPLFVLCAISSVITLSVQNSGGSVASLALVPPDMRISNAIVSCARYLAGTFWPAKLAIFYPLPDAWGVTRVGGAAILLMAVTAIVIMTARKRPYLVVGWLWFLGMLVPVIGLVQVGSQAMADRYTYVPLIGLFVAIVWGARELCELLKIPPALRAGLPLMVLAALAAGTWIQVGYWKSSETLFARAIAVTHENWLALNHLATAQSITGQNEHAIASATEAVRIKPDYSMTHFTLASVLASAGRQEEALAEYRRVVEIDPTMAQAWNNAGVAAAQLGRLADAQAVLEKAVQVAPDYADAKNNLEKIKAAR